MSKTKPLKKQQEVSLLDSFFDMSPGEVLPAYQSKSLLEKWGVPLLIAIAAFVVYIPSFNNAFVSWDDDHYLYNNQQVILPDGWKSCLFDRTFYSNDRFRGNRPESEKNRVSHQYYPLLFGITWAEFQVYKGVFGEEVMLQDGSKARGLEFKMMTPAAARCFHVTSALWHAVNVIILIALLRMLGINTWAASLAAALFALTPVNVASVAWAAERKNIVSMMFYMLAMMSYIQFRRTTSSKAWLLYGLCLVLHICGLMSKTVVVTFPAMIIVTDRLLDGRWSFSSCLRSVPFFAFSGLATLGTIQVEEGRNRKIPNDGPIRFLTMWDTMRFYIQKAILPTGLSPIYRLWNSQVDMLRSILSVVGITALAGVLWRFRKRIPPHAFWGLALYIITVLPMLGLKNINYFQFALVADHYFYHCCIGLFVAIAVLIDWLRRSIHPSSQTILAVAMTIVCVVFGASTWARTSHWEDTSAFWNRVKVMNSHCWPAYYNMGNQYNRDARVLYGEAHDLLKPGASDADIAEGTKILEEARALTRTAAENFTDAGVYFTESKNYEEMYAKAFQIAESLYKRMLQNGERHNQRYSTRLDDNELIREGLAETYRRWADHYYSYDMMSGTLGLAGLASVYEQEDKHDSAAIAYYDLLNAMPYHPSASTGLLANMLKLDDTSELFDKLKRRKQPKLFMGEDYAIMMARGVDAFYNDNDAETARDNLEKVINLLKKRKTSVILPWLVLADIFQSEGDLEKAFACNEQARLVASLPQVQDRDKNGSRRAIASILSRQAAIRLAQGRAEDAERLASQAYKYDPRNPMARKLHEQLSGN